VRVVTQLPTPSDGAYCNAFLLASWSLPKNQIMSVQSTSVQFSYVAACVRALMSRTTRRFFALVVAVTIVRTCYAYSHEGRPGWVVWVAWLNAKAVYTVPANGQRSEYKLLIYLQTWKNVFNAVYTGKPNHHTFVQTKLRPTWNSFFQYAHRQQNLIDLFAPLQKPLKYGHKFQRYFVHQK